MITDFLLDALNWFGMVALGTLPVVEVPAWLNDAGGVAGTVFGYAASMGVWYPAGLALGVLVTLLAAWGIAFAIKLGRIVASFLTLGGGSAA